MLKRNFNVKKQRVTPIRKPARLGAEQMKAGAKHGRKK